MSFEKPTLFFPLSNFTPQHLVSGLDCTPHLGVKHCLSTFKFRPRAFPSTSLTRVNQTKNSNTGPSLCPHRRFSCECTPATAERPCISQLWITPTAPLLY